MQTTADAPLVLPPSLTADQAVRTLASVQHGVVSRTQLRELGLDRHTLHRRVRDGVLHRLSTRVFVLDGSPDTVERRCWAAMVDADGVLSHRSAMAWWDLPGFEVEPIEVTRRRGGRVVESHLATVHAPRLLMPHHVTELRGVPVTSPARTLFDAAPLLPRGRLERALDTAWARGLVNRSILRRTTFELSKQGRSGLRVMRSLLEARDEDYRPPESGLEARFQEVLARRGIDGFERQVDVGGEDTWLGRSDFRHRRRAVVVFVDSALYHSALVDRQRDAAQTEQLEAAGWVVVRVTDVEVFHRPRDVADRVAEALRDAPRRLGVA